MEKKTWKDRSTGIWNRIIRPYVAPVAITICSVAIGVIVGRRIEGKEFADGLSIAREEGWLIWDKEKMQEMRPGTKRKEGA